MRKRIALAMTANILMNMDCYGAKPEFDPYTAAHDNIASSIELFNRNPEANPLKFIHAHNYLQRQNPELLKTQKEYAQYRQGMLYSRGGEDVRKNPSEAIRLLKPLKNNANALYEIGRIYYFDGVESEKCDAIIYLKMAAEKGHQEAQFLLLEISKNQDETSDQYELEIYSDTRRNFTEETSEDQKDASDQYKLGMHFYAERDFSEAERLWESSLRQSNEDAIRQLNNPHVQYRFGLMYLEGDEVVPNARKARKYIESAAAQGHERALAKLEQLNEIDLISY